MIRGHPRRSAFDIAEALQLSQAVATLHHEGILDALREPRSASELAKPRRWDATMLRGVLDYVSTRTTLIRKNGENFIASNAYDGQARFLLDMYAGAYRRNAETLARLLRQPSEGPKVVDRVRYARAFEAAADSALGATPGLVSRLGFERVFDLGCGAGALLLQLARGDAQFTGWGIDANPDMCRAARRKIRAASFQKRIRVITGDIRNLRKALAPEVTAKIGALTACNVLNEMFRTGPTEAVTWLRGLRSLFRGRPLLVVDYYGRLGLNRRDSAAETLLHDYVQLISGQGIPPASVDDWRKIYVRSGCRLVHTIDDMRSTRFIHVVKL